MPPPSSKPGGVFLYIHGGGYILAHCGWFGDTLNAIAKVTNLTVISPEYRLASRRPLFPCGPEDVCDVAEYLIDNSVSTYCGPLKFVAGESAGSTLSMFIILYLLVARPKFSFQGSRSCAGCSTGVFRQARVIGPRC